MSGHPAEVVVAPAPVDLVQEITRLALASACRSEFRFSALVALGRAVPFSRAAWEERPPFGERRVLVPGVDGQGVHPLLAVGVARLELERLGKVRAVLVLERVGREFTPEEVEQLRAVLPTLILADEGTAGGPALARTLNPREAELVDFVRLGYTNAQIALATGRSLAAVRNLLVRIFDKTGVRSRAQLVGGPLITAGLTRREQQIVEHLRAGLTNREIGLTLGISTNTVRNTLARLFEKMGVSTRSELMGALAERFSNPHRPGGPGTVW